MCRLLAWTGSIPRSGADALGAAVDDFVALGHAHPDGWGMAWWPADRPGGPDPSALRSTAPSATDPALRAALAGTLTDAGMVHLRWATPGLAVSPENCHPFVAGGTAMAHNGGIYPFDRLEGILTPEWNARRAGTTDSERYFLSVVAAARGGETADVVAPEVRRLFAGWAPSSLNAAFLTPTTLLVVCAYDPNVALELPEPPDVYYRLSWRADAGGVVVASSGFSQPEEDGWVAMDNMSMLVIPRGGGRPETRPLSVGRAR